MNRYLNFAVFTFFTFIFFSCSTTSEWQAVDGIKIADESSNDLYSSTDNSTYITDAATDEDIDKTLNSMMENANSRKLTYNSFINITVKNLDSASTKVKAIALKFEGYAAELGSKKCVIRVPKSQLQNAISDLEKIGKTTFKQTKANDITDQYFDTEIRLENAQKARERYLELLAKAENVQAALLVEKELERLNGIIDRNKAQLKNYDQSEKFSTISINLTEKRILGPLGYIGKGLYYCVKWLFVIK